MKFKIKLNVTALYVTCKLSGLVSDKSDGGTVIAAIYPIHFCTNILCLQPWSAYYYSNYGKKKNTEFCTAIIFIIRHQCCKNEKLLSRLLTETKIVLFVKKKKKYNNKNFQTSQHTEKRKNNKHIDGYQQIQMAQRKEA